MAAPGIIPPRTVSMRRSRHALGSSECDRPVCGRDLFVCRTESRGRDRLLSRLQRPCSAGISDCHCLPPRRGHGRQSVRLIAAIGQRIRAEAERDALALIERGIHSAGAPRNPGSPRNSARARRIIRVADDIPRQAITEATAMSGHGVPDAHTPAPATMTAMLAMQSLRVHSQTDMAWLSAARYR